MLEASRLERNALSRFRESWYPGATEPTLLTARGVAADTAFMERCRFTTSWGGVVRCGDEAFKDGFCRFHYECWLRGEITERGIISERLSDQERRRAINFHAVGTHP